MPFSEGSAVLPPPEAKAEGSQAPEKSGPDLRKKWLEEKTNDLSLPPFLVEEDKRPASEVKTSSAASNSVEDLALPPFMPSNLEQKTSPPPPPSSDLDIPPFLRNRRREQVQSNPPPAEPIAAPPSELSEPVRDEEEVIKIKPEDIIPPTIEESYANVPENEKIGAVPYSEDEEDENGEKVTVRSETEPKGKSLAGSAVDALSSGREALVGWMESVGRKLPRFHRERPDNGNPDQPSNPTEGEALTAKIESDPKVDPETKSKAVEVNQSLDTLEGAINQRLFERQNTMMGRLAQRLGGSQKITAGMAVALSFASILSNGIVFNGAIDSLTQIASGTKAVAQHASVGGGPILSLGRGGFGIWNYGNLSSRLLMGKVLAKEVPEAFQQTEEAIEKLKDPTLSETEKYKLTAQLEQGIARQLFYYRQGIDIQRYYNQQGTSDGQPPKGVISRCWEWAKTDEGQKVLIKTALYSTPMIVAAIGIPLLGATTAAGATVVVAAKAGMVGTSVASFMSNLKRLRETPSQPKLEKDSSPLLQETINALQAYEQNRMAAFPEREKPELIQHLTKEMDKFADREAARYKGQARQKALWGAIPAAGFYLFANAHPAQAAEHGHSASENAHSASASMHGSAEPHTAGAAPATHDESARGHSIEPDGTPSARGHSIETPTGSSGRGHSIEPAPGEKPASPATPSDDKTFHTPESEVPGGTTNTESTSEGAVPDHEYRDPDYRPNFTDKLSGEGATKPFGEVYGPEGDKHAVIDMNGDGVAQTAEEVKIIEKDGHYSALVQWADIYGKDGRPDYMHDHAVRIDMAPGDKGISISGKFGRLVSLDDPDRYISGFDKNGHPIEGSSTTAEIFQFSRKADVVEFHVSADTWSKVQEREDLKRDDWNLIVGRSGAIACNEEGAAEFQIDWQHVDDRLVGMANDTTFEYVPTVEPQNHDAILAATGGNEELTTVIEKKSFVFDNLGFRLEAIVIPASAGDSRVAITHAIEALRDTSFGMGDQIKAIWSDPSEKHKLIETLASNVHDGRISADQIREALLIPPKMSSITMGGAGWPWHEYGKRMQDWAKETMDHYKTTPWTISLKAIANITETRDKEIKTFSIGYNGLGQKIAEIELENHQKLQYIVPKESFPLGELEPKLK